MNCSKLFPVHLQTCTPTDHSSNTRWSQKLKQKSGIFCFVTVDSQWRKPKGIHLSYQSSLSLGHALFFRFSHAVTTQYFAKFWSRSPPLFPAFLLFPVDIPLCDQETLRCYQPLLSMLTFLSYWNWAVPWGYHLFHSLRHWCDNFLNLYPTYFITRKWEDVVLVLCCLIQTINTLSSANCLSFEAHFFNLSQVCTLIHS